MAYTSIEIIALILIIISAIKVVVLLIKPQAWMNFTKKLWKNSVVMGGVSLILAAIVLYYLTQSGMTIVQILAAGAFIALLIAVGLAGHVDCLMKEYASEIKAKTLWKKHWLYTLIWVVLLVWGAYTIFM